MSAVATKKEPLTQTSISLIEYYNEALKDIDTDLSIEDLFERRLAHQFIKDRFRKEVTNVKVKKCIEMITPFRAIHTVSTFLLGLTIRNHLQFNTRSWRRLPGQKSPQGSFILFWSWICLFHDIGYQYEENTAKYSSIKSIKDLITYLNVEHSLLESSNNSQQIENYFKMRRNNEKPKLDHGIVGALLLFDALMDLAKNSDQYSAIKEHKAFFVKICDTIALHNMWRATDETVKRYQQYNLDVLIPGNDLHHMIYYRDDELLFLLALVDTIDPIKAFCQDGRHKNPKTATFVLKNTYLRFIRSGVKKLVITFEDPDFITFANRQITSDAPLSSWLGVHVVYPEKNSGEKEKKGKALSIAIDLQGTAFKSAKSA